MKFDMLFCLIFAVLFTLCIPLGFWLDDWTISRVSLAPIWAALGFWLGYIRARELDRKIKSGATQAEGKTPE
jgi:hypothetical protein